MTPDELHRIQVSLKGAFIASAEDVSEDLGLDFDWILPEALKYGEERGAELIGKTWLDGALVDNPDAKWAITDWTRERSNEMLQEALKTGRSYQDFSSRLEDSGLFSDARADLVARNEIALAMAGGKAASYREADVDYVVIVDGDFDDECQARNGTIVALEDWEDEPYLHPNCTADARPATQSELAEAGLIDTEEQEAA